MSEAVGSAAMIAALGIISYEIAGLTGAATALLFTGYIFSRGLENKSIRL